MNLSTAYQSSLSTRARDTLLTLVTERDTATISELKDIIHANPDLGSLTLADLFTKPSKTKHKSVVQVTNNGAGASPVVKMTVAPIQDFNLRTEPGRKALDAEVLRVLKQQGGKDIAASAMRPVIGVTDTQLRASLNRLIEAELVEFEGLARATRYSLA
jgi:hypothetical protein